MSTESPTELQAKLALLIFEGENPRKEEWFVGAKTTIGGRRYCLLPKNWRIYNDNLFVPESNVPWGCESAWGLDKFGLKTLQGFVSAKERVAASRRKAVRDSNRPTKVRSRKPVPRECKKAPPDYGSCAMRRQANDHNESTRGEIAGTSTILCDGKEAGEPKRAELQIVQTGHLNPETQTEGMAGGGRSSNFTPQKQQDCARPASIDGEKAVTPKSAMSSEDSLVPACGRAWLPINGS